MQRLRSQLALAAFLRDLGEAVEEAELVIWRHTWCYTLILRMLGGHDDNDDGNDGWVCWR